MKAKMDIHREKMEVAVCSIWSELEGAINHRVENILLSVEQKLQGLCKELTGKIEETQVDLQAVNTSIDTWTRSLKGDITDVKDFHKSIENTMDDPQRARRHILVQGKDNKG
jgi:actin-like ATPase involved in cell morphogenesis